MVLDPRTNNFLETGSRFELKLEKEAYFEIGGRGVEEAVKNSIPS
jgi:hypothetical protein